MLMTVEPEIQRNLEPLHAHEMLKDLKTLFSQQAEQELLQTTRDFHSCRQEEGQSVSSYVLKMKGYIDNLEHLGMGKTVNELHAMLKLHEQTLPKRNAPALNVIRAGKVQKGNKHKKSHFQMAARGQNHGKGKNKQAYAPKPKIPPPPKRENLAKDSICHECGDIGHWKRNCPQYLAELMKKKKNTSSGAGGLGIFVIELNIILNRSWIYDTGCGTHICNTPQGLRASRKLKPGALSVGEYMSQEFLDHLKDHGIITHRTPPYTPQHNGVSERRNRTLLDMVRSMMSQTTLPKSFWDYELETAARILNMVSTKKVEKTPYEETMGYSFYYPPENKVLVARNAEFLENSLINQEASRSLEDLEIIQEEDTSTRARRASTRMCLYIDTEEHKLGDLGEPANYKAALLDHESEKWLNAMNVEMQSMKDNEVWVLIELPPNGKLVGSKWLFKKKTDMDRVVHTYKARLVAKGYTQTPRIDYEETFSPVADIRAIRILIAITAYYDYEIWQMDVKTAFLNDISMKRFTWSILKVLSIQNIQTGSIPIQEKLKLSKSQGASTLAELKRMQNVPYASVVGSIMYAVRCTRPDVAFAQNTGYMFVLNGGSVDWKSAKQSIFATSSAEAEYIAAFDASKEAVWVRKFISELGVVPTIEEPISMYCDNT
nr:zinc finger, CCHC-type [Tanacetum cinerariifolium]